MPSDQLPDTLPNDVNEKLRVRDDGGGAFKKNSMHHFGRSLGVFSPCPAPSGFEGMRTTEDSIVDFVHEATESLEPAGEPAALSDDQGALSYATAATRCRSRYTLQMPLIRVST